MKFTDRKNRTWDLELVRLPDIKRLKAELEIDFFKLPENNFEQLFALLTDPPKLVDAIACLLEPQLKAANITPDDFGSAIDGDTLESMGTQAFPELVRAWLPSSAREGVKKTFDKAKRGADLLGRRAASKIEALDVETIADEMERQASVRQAQANGQPSSRT
jgi:hypothetical protein